MVIAAQPLHWVFSSWAGGPQLGSLGLGMNWCELCRPLPTAEAQGRLTTTNGKHIPFRMRPTQPMVPTTMNAEALADWLNISKMTAKMAPAGKEQRHRVSRVRPSVPNFAAGNVYRETLGWQFLSHPCHAHSLPP